MRKQNKRNRETRRLHIACDMDGSIASFVHGTKINHQRVPIPEWYKTAILEAIKREILQTSTEDYCQDTLITMKLFTLRKDKPTDQIIALRNKTNLACKILEQFSNSLAQIIDPRTCAITVDSQYHHNQLFGSGHGATYTEGIHCIDTRYQSSAPWAKQSFFTQKAQGNSMTTQPRKIVKSVFVAMIN